jgi:phosphoribosylformylglycinamidine synthase
MGLLPMANGVRCVALDQNREGDFIDRWETLILNRKSPCIWTKNLPYDSLDLPVRHGEGRLTLKEDFVLPHEQEVFYYARDINGSFKRIAGITDPKGQILGLMPHPEGYFYKGFHPQCTTFKEAFDFGPGSFIFKNAIEHCQKKEEEYA